ncbi:PREDICTED: uncharacterized protein LOC108616518 [Drosophila arizonae]|uniref:Uncharacterized protein LOC108616518 n=1 Tax=Drosophila arizonae TaxID=7263 RepID=A0ABM1PJ58_DROAR|nr:PREDICTED: uncharacterized protein LOC108616518 [Drosophila arizonae]
MQNSKLPSFSLASSGGKGAFPPLPAPGPAADDELGNVLGEQPMALSCFLCCCCSCYSCCCPCCYSYANLLSVSVWFWSLFGLLLEFQYSCRVLYAVAAPPAAA